MVGLNDEHQGEGGTLVFVASNNTTILFLLQVGIIIISLDLPEKIFDSRISVPRAGIEPTSKP